MAKLLDKRYEGSEELEMEGWPPYWSTMANDSHEIANIAKA